MENLDVMVLRTLRDWRLGGKRALLATVVRTWGSSPRPVGSIMALCEDGLVVGSVSGGCIEDDLIYRHTQAYSARTPPTRFPPARPASSNTASRPTRRTALACPAVARSSCCWSTTRMPAILATLVSALEAGRLMQRTVRLADGLVSLREATAPAEASMCPRPNWSIPLALNTACC